MPTEAECSFSLPGSFLQPRLVLDVDRLLSLVESSSSSAAACVLQFWILAGPRCVGTTATTARCAPVCRRRPTVAPAVHGAAAAARRRGKVALLTAFSRNPVKCCSILKFVLNVRYTFLSMTNPLPICIFETFLSGWSVDFCIMSSCLLESVPDGLLPRIRGLSVPSSPAAEGTG